MHKFHPLNIIDMSFISDKNIKNLTVQAEMHLASEMMIQNKPKEFGVAVIGLILRLNEKNLVLI